MARSKVRIPVRVSVPSSASEDDLRYLAEMKTADAMPEPLGLSGEIIAYPRRAKKVR